MSAIEITRDFEKKFQEKRMIYIKTKTVRELKSIAKEKVLRGYYKLNKADLVALLLEQSAEDIPTRPPRAWREKRRPAIPVKIISSLQEWMNLRKKR